jgi:hypothetical protein
MAPKTDTSFDTFLADVLAAIPEEQRGTVEEALKAEAVTSVVRPRVLAQADYSRNMDALKTERAAFEQEVQEAQRKINGWNEWYQSTSEQTTQMKDQLAKYQEAYGDLDEGSGGVRTPSGNQNGVTGMTEEQVKEMVETARQAGNAEAIAFADALTDIKLDHRANYKEKLDTVALIEFAHKNGLPITHAYEQFVSDKREAKQKEELDERIKQERESAVAEYASKHNLPVIPSANEVMHTLDTETKVSRNPNDRVSNAVASFLGGRGGSQ